MQITVAHFTSVAFLMRAFDRVIDNEWVDSCSVEPERCRLRFVAPPKAAAALVARIYLDGGLEWCSRHTLK